MSTATKMEWTSFKGDFRCPICAGAEDDPRGQSRRCTGGMSENGELCVCTRIESRTPSASATGGWLHILKGDCPCGTRHGAADPKPATIPFARGGTKPKAKPEAKVHASIEKAADSLAHVNGWGPWTHWTYRNADGSEAFIVVRFKVPIEVDPKEKTYRPYRPVGGGWQAGKPPGKLVLYNRPGLPRSGRAYLFEGEKIADMAKRLGLISTACAHGAKSPQLTDFSPLAGLEVAVVIDNDDDGESFGDRAGALLAAVGALPKIVRLPGLKNKGDDLEQWLDLRRSEGKTDDEIRAELEQLADAAEIAKATTPTKRSTAAKTTELDASLAKRPRTDLGNGERMVARFGSQLRFCGPWGKWLVWDGRRFAIDQKGAVDRLAKKTVRKMFAEASTIEDDDKRKQLVHHATGSESRASINAMIAMASTEEGIPVLVDEMDRDGWLFNCANGTVDLRTGSLRPHDQADLITQLCPVPFDPNAKCPLWDATLDLFFAGDQRLITYWQRLCGYCLAGVIRDHVMPIAYGTGSNGKSTILGTMMDMMGADYAMKAPRSMLMAKTHETHPTDQADLFGKRLVVAIETDSGRRLDEVMVKELTGGDAVRARRMREDFWEFKPTHTLVMATNHKPVIRGTDHGIWRRLKLVPFTVTMDDDKADKSVPEKLRAEFPGILSWAVRGCLAWKEIGLAEPDAVKASTAEYRGEQDVIGAFLAEKTLQDATLGNVRCGEVYGAYKEWAEKAGEPQMSLRAFGDTMKERGYVTKTSNGKWYVGLGIRKASPTTY